MLAATRTMPAIYRIDAERGVVFSSYSGVLTDADLTEHQRALRADPEFSRDFDQLSNFLDVTQVQVTSSTVRQLAKSRSFRPGVRRAFVVSTDLAYGLSRMFQLLHEQSGEDLQLFRDLDEARQWLGIEGRDPRHA